MILKVVVAVLFFGLVSCTESKTPVAPDPTVNDEKIPKPPLELVDISKSPVLSSKGRFQTGETALGETNQVAKDLVANGKDAIPFLISKLDDETEIDRHIMPFWYQLHVGDLALIILGDLFTDETEVNSTIPGFGWDDFLERGGDESLMGEEVLRRYIRKYGRKKIKERWQEMWERNKDKISWDEKCYCFKIAG